MTAHGLLSVDATLAALPVRKSRRWLLEFLHSTKTDPHGRPLYRQLGRDKLIYIDRLIEALPCPSKSSKVATKKRKISTSGGPISASQWTEAAELLNDPSLVSCETSSRMPSSGENTLPENKRPRLVVNNPRS